MLQKFLAAFGGDHRGSLGGGRVRPNPALPSPPPSLPPPLPSDPPPPPSFQTPSPPSNTSLGGGGFWVGPTKGLLIQVGFSLSQIWGQDLFGGGVSEPKDPPPSSYKQRRPLSWDTTGEGQAGHRAADPPPPRTGGAVRGSGVACGRSSTFSPTVIWGASCFGGRMCEPQHRPASPLPVGNLQRDPLEMLCNPAPVGALAPGHCPQDLLWCNPSSLSQSVIPWLEPCFHEV